MVAVLYKRFLILTALNIASNLSTPLASLFDTAMLGNIDEQHSFKGVALASLIFDYIYWPLGFLRMSTVGLSGASVKEGVEHFRVLYRALILAVLLSLTILSMKNLILNLGLNFIVIAHSDLSSAIDYYNIRVWGLPAGLMNMVLTGWLLGRGQSGTVLVINVVGNSLNVALNYYFIMQTGWGAYGAGLSTILSQYVMSLIAFTSFFLTKPKLFPLKGLFDLKKLGIVFKLNLNLVIRTLALLSVFALFINISSAISDELNPYLSANEILRKLLLFTAFLIDGAAFAMETLAAFINQYQNKTRLKKLVVYASLLGLSLSIIEILILEVSPLWFLGLINKHHNILYYSYEYRYYLYLTVIVASFAFIFDGFFLGLLRGAVLRNTVVISLTLAVPFIFWGYKIRSNDFLWMGMVVFMSARSILLFFVSRKFFRNLA